VERKKQAVEFIAKTSVIPICSTVCGRGQYGVPFAGKKLG
jgi:hypothetical protein